MQSTEASPRGQTFHTGRAGALGQAPRTHGQLRGGGDSAARARAAGRRAGPRGLATTWSRVSTQENMTEDCGRRGQNLQAAGI